MKIPAIVKSSFFALIILGIAETATAQISQIPSGPTRTCVIEEVFDSSGYSYIRCQEGNREYWIATQPVKLTSGEQISFEDKPPLVDFWHRFLKRTFPIIYFAAEVSRTGDLEEPQSVKQAPSLAESITPEQSIPPNDETYHWTDETGVMHFTDDPSNVPRKNKKKVKYVE